MLNGLHQIFAGPPFFSIFFSAPNFITLELNIFLISTIYPFYF